MILFLHMKAIWGRCVWGVMWEVTMVTYSAQLSTSSQLRTIKASWGKDEGVRVCKKVCCGFGLWRSRNTYKSFSPPLSCSNAPRLKPVCADLGIDNDFKPFIADTGVSSDGSKERANKGFA